MSHAHYDEREHAIFRAGQEAALRFNAGSHLIHQDVFKAESANWKLYVSYDDVEFGNTLTITFKDRWDNDGALKQVTIQCGTAKKGIERALKFIARHPVEEPRCDVDY